MDFFFLFLLYILCLVELRFFTLKIDRSDSELNFEDLFNFSPSRMSIFPIFSQCNKTED